MAPDLVVLTPADIAKKIELFASQTPLSVFLTDEEDFDSRSSCWILVDMQHM